MTMDDSMRTLVVGTLCTAAVTAQGEVFEHVALRASSLRPDGSIVVDRGKRDLVQVGDRVVFSPRNGPVLHGSVTVVDERTALVELVDRTAVVAIGTRGQVMVPRTRLAAATKTPPPTSPPHAADADEWRPGMPLLGTTRPPRPEERAAMVTGRTFVGADLVRTLGSYSQSFLRTGGEVEVDNIAGDGGTLRFAGEFTLLTETSGREGADLRLYDLSYEHGGTRFAPLRWQIGRFLPRDMPELGLLDGAEIGYRLENGDRFGGSLGFLPELDDDMATGTDLQVAGWYLGTSDLSERLTWGLAFQKTWHHRDADRDLFVAKVRCLPASGWDLAATLWIDVYDGSDAGKGKGLGLTRANALAAHRWASAGGLEFAYDHEEYPETLRDDTPQQVLPQTLLDAHQDRLSAHGWWLDGGTRWHARATGWIDEERQGGAIEFGCDLDGLLAAGTRTGVTVFDVQGLTSSVLGVRFDHGGAFAGGRLDLLYELGFVHHEGFPADRDDLLQHRLALLCSTDLGSRWNATFHADGTLWDDELSLGVGFYLQRNF
jgi:hypothetical protein